jgi:membrane protein YqaA with SNARE-associated domain
MIIYLNATMWWKYLLVFFSSLLVDVFPVPLPPACMVMVFLQIQFHLQAWPVIIFGVLGSIAGRYILTLYIASVSANIFNKAKNEQVQYLGKKLKNEGWKSQLFILLYSLLPIPTTPLFVAAGMGKIRPLFIIPPFFIGKAISDALAVLLGKYAAENSATLLHGAFSLKSAIALAFGLLLIAAILFVEWRSLLEDKKLKINFRIWK